jgi:hypothetical protein
MKNKELLEQYAAGVRDFIPLTWADAFFCLLQPQR